MIDDPDLCLLCGDAAEWGGGVGDLSRLCKCEKRCGHYSIGIWVVKQLGNGDFSREVIDRHLISGFTRELFDRWKHAPDSEHTIPRFPAIADFQHATKLAPRSIADRAAKLLAAIHRRTKFFGASAALTVADDYPLGYARNETEFWSLLRYLKERRWLDLLHVSAIDNQIANVSLTADGFAEVEGRQASNLEAKQAFIARWFHADMDRAYDVGIKPAVEESGFIPIPVNVREYNGDVVDQIIVEIRKSRFVIADTTGHRGGVYFEAGFAKGLGLEVIFSCKKGEFDKSHFDVNHMNHIVWNNEEDLHAQLARRIQSTIGFGPLKPST
jgi:hypothetical protein